MGSKASQLERHLQRVAGSELELNTAADPAEAAREGFGSYGRYWVESFRIPYLTDRTIDRGFSFIGYHKIEQVRAGGVGPILVLPHLGGWEWAAAWLGRIAKVDVTAVVERLEPPEVFDWFARLRQAYGVNVVPLGPRAMVDLLAAAKRRDVICLLSDRDIGGNGVPVRFFGEETTLPAGPALLARRAGAPLMPTAVYFHNRQRICVVGDPFWPDQFSETGKDLNRRIMQEVANRLEELVAQAPEQWHLLEPNWPSDHRP
jgi:KDO2-lipid IV(A) lauroyltransferase